MKHIILIIAILLLPTKAFSNENELQKRLIASALEEYGKVAGAWYLNEKCNYIKNEEKSKFKDNVALITVALAKDLASPKLLYPIQNSAKNIIEKPKYSDCKGKTKDIFSYGYNHSINWSNQIRILQQKQSD